MNRYLPVLRHINSSLSPTGCFHLSRLQICNNNTYFFLKKTIEFIFKLFQTLKPNFEDNNWGRYSSVIMSRRSLCEIYCFSQCTCFFSNTYVLYTIRKGFWCRLNRTFVCVSVCKSSRVLIMSHSLLWRHIVLLTVGVYSSNHRVLYTIGLSMTRRFQKSVGPSVRL